MSGRIILLRHGQTHSNVAHKLDTRPPGAELTDLGRNQARDVGYELAEYCEAGRGSAGRLVAVTSSIALRAQQTALLAMQSYEKAAGLEEHSIEIDVVPGVHEIFAGDHEMKSDEESHRLYSEAMYGWLNRDSNMRMPGGEGFVDIVGRYQPVLETAIKGSLDNNEDKDVLVVSHGAVIRTIAAYAADVDPEFAFAGYLANCRYIVLEPNGQPFGQWAMSRWADLDHQI